MSTKYPHLLSPLQIGDVLLKNRMMATAGMPHMLQGTEEYPTEKLILHLQNRARNGAAAVFLNFFMGGRPGDPADPDDIALYNAKMGFQTHDLTSRVNIAKTSSHNYLCQLIDAIRYYESVAITMPFGSYTREGPMPGPGMKPGTDGKTGPGGGPDGFHVNDPEKQLKMEQDNCMGHPIDHVTKKQIQEYIDTTVANAKNLKLFGFEMFSIHNAYHNSLASEFWSELCNHRQDEYGGSVKGRAKLFLDLYDALRQTFGPDFPLETLISVEGPGVNIQDTIELAKMAQGKVDIFHIRHGLKDPQHPVGFTSSREKPCPNLDGAAALKQALTSAGIKMLVGVSAGLQNPDFNEKILADGKADIICMSRAFICDSEYGDKIYSGNTEDITPCIRCNKCHVPNDSDKFRSFCSVNPKIGIEQKLGDMTKPVTNKKKVAVIGGGPAGMKAAITCAQRGHSVTLYEKADSLGGQLFHADYPSFKWALADFRDWLIKQTYKNGVQVILSTEATTETLKGQGFDEVIVAIGPSFEKPKIKGVDGSNVISVMDVYGHEQELPKNIVVIGGSETGTETGMYLAETGHNVVVMTRQGMLSADAAHAHYVVMQMEAYNAMPNFKRERWVKKYIAIDEKGVEFVDENGETRRFDCDMVVVSGGVKARAADAAKFYDSAWRTHYIGDCVRAGDVHKAITAGYAVGNQI